MTTTTNMGLALGTVGAGGDTQETWANIINENARTVDEHNHTSGSGTRIPSAGININADLPANNRSITGLETTAFTAQSAALASSFKSCVYVVAGNLYFNNGAGSSVQVTTGSAVNVGSTGTISGMTGTASVAFNGTSTFSFSRSSGVYANIASSGMQLFFTTVGAANGLTLGVQANLPTAYSVLFPIQTPNAAGGDIFPELDTSGNITWRKSIINDGTNTVGKVAYFSDAKTLSSIALGAGQLLIGTSTSTAPSAAALTGTANQVTVTLGSGAVTLSLPQNIHSLATPTFAGLTLSGALTLASTAVISGAVTMSNLVASRVVVTDGSKVLTSVNYTASNTVNTIVLRGGSGEIAIGALEASTGTFSGAITAMNGAAATPGIAFANSANTGFYSSSAGVVSFASGGSFIGGWVNTGKFTIGASGGGQVHDINGGLALTTTLAVTGVSTLAGLSATAGTFSTTLAVTGLASFASAIRASDGTQAAPGIAFTNSTGTGFYSTGAGILSFASGGSAIGGWSAAGKFTIGAVGGGQVHQIEGGMNLTTTLAVAGVVNLASLTASQVVVTDGSKNLSSLAYAVGYTSSALVQRSALGDFTARTVTLTGDLTAALSVTANLVDTTQGISTGGNGGASRIKWKVLAQNVELGVGPTTVSFPHGLSAENIVDVIGSFSTTSGGTSRTRIELHNSATVWFGQAASFVHIDATNVYVRNGAGANAFVNIIVYYI